MTLDPIDEAREATPEGHGNAFPSLEIVFHSDLNRIGERTAVDLLAPRRAVTVGREYPLFRHPAGGPDRPLLDPCISREQLSVTYLARDYFTVSAARSSRRPVELLSLDASPLPSDAPVKPGTLIAIGDRVLLLLALRRPHSAVNRMGLTGESEPMWSLHNKIRGAAASDGTVLIYGESGVGKELVAQSIHRNSVRHDYPQVVVNCAAIPENLLESALFGHVRGAFTGATSDKEGFFQAAGHGSIFLDEIGELPLSMQGKLLRVLQERRACPVGGSREEAINARVIAATNRDLVHEVAADRFRKDLYYRLTTLTIEVPPLRNRREDIMPLFCAFLEQSSERHPELRRLWREANQQIPPVPITLVKLMHGFAWPGNVRHLRNIVEKTAVANIHRAGFVIPDEVLHELRPQPTSGTSPAVAHEGAGAIDDHTSAAAGGQPRTMTPDENTLLALLEEHDYVQRRVARAAGVSHTTVDRWMRELGLRRPRDISREELEDTAQRTGSDLDAMARLLKVSRRGLKLRMASLGI